MDLPLMMMTMGGTAPVYKRILATQQAKLLAYWPLNDLSGTVAKNKAPGRIGINIVRNPGFEDENVLLSNYWTEVYDSGQIYPQGGAALHSGVNGLAIISGGVGKDTHIWQAIPVTPGLNYTIKVWTFGNGTVGLRIRIARGDFASFVLDVDTQKTGGVYSQYTNTFDNPADNSLIYLQMVCPAAVGAFVYIDDVELFANTPDPTVFDGIYTGGVTLNQAGFSGPSALFDGADDYIPLTIRALVNSFPTLAAAGSMLIYGKTSTDILADGLSHWLFKYKSAAPERYIDVFSLGNNNLGVQFCDDTSGQIMIGCAWTSPDWFSMGVTWSVANGVKMFVNKNKVASGSGAGLAGTWASNWDNLNESIGTGLDSPTGWWNGNLQHHSIWDAELTEAEMIGLGK